MQIHLKRLLEAAEDVENNPAALPDDPVMKEPMPAPPQQQPPVDPAAAGGDPTMGGMGADPTMGGTDSMGKPMLSPIDIGRAYELKKIYTRLSALESYLADTSDIELLRLRELVVKAMDLFDIVVSNFDSYKDKINNIIVMFYKFTQRSYDIFKDHLKKKAAELEKQNKENKRPIPDHFINMSGSPDGGGLMGVGDNSNCM